MNHRSDNNKRSRVFFALKFILCINHANYCHDQRDKYVSIINKDRNHPANGFTLITLLFLIQSNRINLPMQHKLNSVDETNNLG